MFIKRIRKKIGPKGFVTIVGAVHTIGVEKFKSVWLKRRFQDDLPFRVGHLEDKPSIPSLDNHAWEYQDGSYERIQEELAISIDDVAEAKDLFREFREVTDTLKKLVLDGKVGLVFQSTEDGELPATAELMGILRAQWKWLIETGQVRVRREGPRDRLLTVFFEERRLVKATRNVGKNKQAKLDRALADWLVQRLVALRKRLETEFPVKKEQPPTFPLNFDLNILFARRLTIWKEKLIDVGDDGPFSPNTFRKWIWDRYVTDLPRKISWRPSEEKESIIKSLIDTYIACLEANNDDQPGPILDKVFGNPKIQKMLQPYKSASL